MQKKKRKKVLFCIFQQFLGLVNTFATEKVFRNKTVYAFKYAPLSQSITSEILQL